MCCTGCNDAIIILALQSTDKNPSPDRKQENRCSNRHEMGAVIWKVIQKQIHFERGDNHYTPCQKDHYKGIMCKTLHEHMSNMVYMLLGERVNILIWQLCFCYAICICKYVYVCIHLYGVLVLYLSTSLRCFYGYSFLKTDCILLQITIPGSAITSLRCFCPWTLF